MDYNERLELLQTVVDESDSQYVGRLNMIKKMAKQYEHDATARSILDEALAFAHRIGSVTSEELAIFNESFISPKDGPRRISERHYMSSRTVFRIQARVFERLLPIVFGIDGIKFQA